MHTNFSRSTPIGIFVALFASSPLVSGTSIAQSLEEQYKNQNYQRDQKEAIYQYSWQNAQFFETNYNNTECSSRAEGVTVKYLLNSKNEVYRVNQSMHLVEFVGILNKPRYYKLYKEGATYESLVKMVYDNGLSMNTLVLLKKDPYAGGRVSRTFIACNGYRE